MKRTGNLYSLIMDQENLRTAFRKAAKGKSHHPEVVAFREDFDANIERIRRQLIAHTPDIGHYRFFQVREPKLRKICAASFPERVLHHAIMNVCEPVLESYAVFDSYACRKGKGARKALARASDYAKNYSWYLKLDIRKYFDSIDHAIIMNMLEKRFKDHELLHLFHQLFVTYHTQTCKGLPIGNLISQHLANFYLGLLDHWIKEVHRIKGYVRYMDDFLVFSNQKMILKTILEHIRQFLAEELALELKDNIQLNRSSHGIPFLGFRVFPDKILLLRQSRERFSRKFRYYENRYLSGEWSERELVRHTEPLIEFTRAANSAGFRRNVFERFGVLS